LSDVTSNNPKKNARAMSQITKDAITYEQQATIDAINDVTRKLNERLTTLGIPDLLPIPHRDINKKFAGFFGCCVHCLLSFEEGFKKDLKRMSIPRYIKQKPTPSMEKLPAHYSHNTVYTCEECDKRFDPDMYVDWMMLKPPNPETA